MEPSSKPPSKGASAALVVDGNLAIRLMRDTDDDYRLMSGWLNDEQVMPFWHGRDERFPIERIQEKYGPRVRGEAPTTPCFITVEDRPIGYIQFYRTDDWTQWRDTIGLASKPDRWALDVVIGEPERWNQGLGTRAVKALLGYLFTEEKASEVVLTPLAANGRAIRCYEKAGFDKTRLVAGGEFHEGEFRDAWLMTAVPRENG